jgi:hypothetical protein
MNELFSKEKRPLVKVERTRTELRDDVAIRIYTELVLNHDSVKAEFPNADELRAFARDALDAAFVFQQERYEDRRLQRNNR